MGTLKLRLAIAGAFVIAISVAVTVVQAIGEMQARTEGSIIESNLGVAQLAASLSASVVDRERALSAAAQDWPRGQLADPQRVQAFLAQTAVLRMLFNDVTVVAGGSADLPARPMPVATRAQGAATHTGHVMLAAPLPTGETRPPYVAGVLRLDETNFLSGIAAAAALDAGNIRTIVADQQGRVLAHAERQKLMTAIDDEPGLRGIVERWRRQGSPLEPAPWTERSGDRFAAMAAVPGTDWVVFRVANAEALFGEATRSASRTVALGLLVGLAGALAIFAITAWFMRPMGQLSRRALRAVDAHQAPAEGWPAASGEVGELSHVLRDVSVQLAASRREMEQALQRMHAVLAHAPVGIAFTTDARFDLVSSELERLTGYASGELQGTRWEALLCPDEQPALRDAVEAAFREGRWFRGEMPLRRRDGSMLWAHVHGTDLKGDRMRRIWIVSDATEARRQRESLLWSATRDPLTELVNRREFERQLGLLVSDRRRDRACALFIDLDHFKPVNDGAGHAAGDALLKKIAQLLQMRVRADDTVGRLGGDEFAVLLRRCTLAEALQKAQELRTQVELNGTCDTDPSLRVTASIGVVEVDACQGTVAEVLDAADIACYAAKRAGRNAVRPFESRGEH
ncbi:diguanylate cyclase [Caldimonas sp. KR1-144]|uniref:diguanylate cyclase n=1 Tax=Caldimonas sp. KR1-144 TaxID=3400911 RepID=UPI003C0B34E2